MTTSLLARSTARPRLTLAPSAGAPITKRRSRDMDTQHR